MVRPETYRGYDENGNVLITKTAVDATTLINPADVEQAISNVISIAQDYSDKIFNKMLQADASGKRAMLVADANMDDYFSQIESYISKIPGEISNGLNGLMEETNSACDRLQENENVKAYNGCLIENVVSVK